ncbi:MAG: hypothetical protein ACFFG0_27615 [Candidatus Thorarchaeota archaeon]
MSKKYIYYMLAILILLIFTLPTSVLAHTEEDPFKVDLIAGKNKDVGDVLVWNDGDTLYVKFQTTDGWTISETHLAVGDTFDDIPQTKSGNPQIGQFEYSSEHNPAVTECVYEIELEKDWLADTELYLAAHAVVQIEKNDNDNDNDDNDESNNNYKCLNKWMKMKGKKCNRFLQHLKSYKCMKKWKNCNVLCRGFNYNQEETAWGEGKRFTCKNWAMYFKYTIQQPDPWKLLNIPEGKVKITPFYPGTDYGEKSYFDTTLSEVPEGYDITNGLWDGWCADSTIGLQNGETYEAKLYLSTDPNLPAYAKDDEQWDYINYILNQDYSYLGGNYQDIQCAIWYFADANPQLGVAGTSHYTPEITQAIIDDALANGAEFIPSNGQWMAVICDPNDGIEQTLQVNFIVVDP